jgi:hypothetical protein
MENQTILKQIVMNNNLASISHVIAGIIYYQVKTDDATYNFPVDISNLQDVGMVTFPAQIKAITLMRYIRKAIKNEELVKF